MFPLTYLIYLGLIGFGVLIVVSSGSFPGALSPRDIGPAALPRALAIIMIMLIAVDFYLSRRRARFVPFSLVGLALGVGAAVASVIWVATHVGFFMVLPFALFAGLWVSGSRNMIANTLYSLVFPAVLWLLFDKLLQIPIASL
jgi:hypothetical protein